MAAQISRWTAWTMVLALSLSGCGTGDVPTPGATASPSAVASAQPEDEESERDDDRPDNDGQTYVVESGDTLSDIARRFDTTVEAIVEANDIDDPDVIDVGDEFVIPDGR